MPEDRAEVLLHAAYQAEVEFRQRTYQHDAYVDENIKRLATYITGDSTKFGVMLCGLYGNGKTTLLNAFQNAFNWLNNRITMPDPYGKCGICIVDAVDFSRRCRDIDKYDEYCKRPLLALEDIGRDAEQLKVYGDPITPVIDIIEHRYQRQLFTFITTNLTAEELKAKYGKRVTDRFNEMEIIIFNKPDSYRRS